MFHLYHGAELEEIYTYKYDVSGNKISQKKKRSSIEEDNGRLGYHYDALNRLKCVVQGENIRREYEYDAFGNRIKKIEYIEGLEKQTAYTYNEKNQGRCH
jgi:YD repeat-containing protein